ncbi:hypothetical protein ATZ33_14465 [Enterococcus silesiacus]|uniref:LPXTG-domain-containing protein cell wall anchor domain n=1 Tax=Enterococcus silesiacus TaxID=332949 RepID=A0A0S3KER9_9ENTE|nr:LPXTG cell wall anchor domain-containing protein [Enterococcus silesiacus]ALS02537.1 hypothetical protein ATZ33_14465 [Enterococcus silesiacus]OJG93547.1 LPXTG-domain-containing protein cell wall anchor domain [Enterococcus silesiacus]
MKKLILSSMCLFFLAIAFFGTTVQASEKTQSEITFIQGDKENIDLIETINGNIQGIFPSTGERHTLYLVIIGICLLSLLFLGVQLKNKKIRK